MSYQANHAVLPSLPPLISAVPVPGRLPPSLPAGAGYLHGDQARTKPP